MLLQLPLEKEIMDIIVEDETSQDKITPLKVPLKVLLTALEEKIVILKDFDLKLLEFIDGNKIENDIRNSSEGEIKIRKSIATCQQFLDNHLELESLTSSQSSASPVEQCENPLLHVHSEENTLPKSENGSSSSQRHMWNKVTLPKLELPIVNGEITIFFRFWDRFESMVGGNEDLSSTEKLNHLQHSLRKETQTPLDGLPIRHITYKDAVEVLREHFRNTQK